MASLVFNIRPAAASDVRNLSAHELLRAPDGNSAIDPARSHLNRVLVGPRTQSEALDALFASGVRRPAAQSEAPYVQIVLGASADFFRPDDPETAGAFQAERVERFEREALDWLKATFGDDLIHAATHLDETTPHMHVLVAPTYQKAARKPGRKKRGETDEDFAARVREASERLTERTVGRRSNALLSAPNSFQHLRQGLADHLAPLGIGYGADLNPTDPDPQTTRRNLKSENDQLRASNAQEQARAEEARRATEKAVERREALERREEALEAREAALGPELERLAQQRSRIELERDYVDRARELASARRRLMIEDAEARAAEIIAKAKAILESADKVKAEAAEAVEEARRATEKAHQDRTRAEEATRAAEGRLEPVRAALAALDAWEAEKARVEADEELAAWWAMTPWEQLEVMWERRKEGLLANRFSGDEILRMNAEISQLQAENGTIIRVTRVDHETGHISGDNLRTGEDVHARIILTEQERVEHYPDVKGYGLEEQLREAREMLRRIRRALNQVVVGAVVQLVAFKPLLGGREYIAAFTRPCDPPRLDPRETPMAEAAKPATALPEPVCEVIRQAPLRPRYSGPSGP